MKLTTRTISDVSIKGPTPEEDKAAIERALKIVRESKSFLVVGLQKATELSGMMDIESGGTMSDMFVMVQSLNDQFNKMVERMVKEK